MSFFLQVRINVVSSTMHPDRVQFQVLSLASSATSSTNDALSKLGNVTKSDLIQVSWDRLS